MKKYLALATAALLLLCSLISCVQADPNAIDNYTPDINYMDTDAGTFYFAEAEGETAILTSFKSKDNKDDAVVIPDKFIVKDKNGEVIIEPAETTREEGAHEGWIDEGPADRHADRRFGGDHIRRHELADGEALEPEGPPDGQLDLRQGG